MKPLERRVANLERKSEELVGITRAIVSFTRMGDNGEVVSEVGMIMEGGFTLCRDDEESEDDFFRRFDEALTARISTTSVGAGT